MYFVGYIKEIYEGTIQDEYEGILDTWPMAASFEFQHFIYALNTQFTFTNITNTKAKKPYRYNLFFNTPGFCPYIYLRTSL